MKENRKRENGKKKPTIREASPLVPQSKTLPLELLQLQLLEMLETYVYEKIKSFKKARNELKLKIELKLKPNHRYSD